MTDTEKKATVTVQRRVRRIPASTIRPDRAGQFRHDVAAQAVVAGNQDIKVLAVSACASGNGKGHIAVRVGRILVYVEDRDALNAFRDAWSRATDLADSAFGPFAVAGCAG